MEEIRCGVLVIGGGAAGSRAAFEAKRSNPWLDVVLTVCGKYGYSGSTDLVASEALGINAPFNFEGDGDTPDIYYNDTVSTGGGLGDPNLCRIIADESVDRVQELIDMGLEFDSKDGRPIQRLLSGCTKARSLTCGGTTGREIVRVLGGANHKIGVKIIEDVRIIELLKDETGRLCGALGLINGQEVIFKAGAIVLVTGGAGRMFRKNVNPPAQRGDGWAIAYEAGASFVNMEFFQIGPAVVKPHIKFIIHSHMWRFIPKLTNSLGEEFLQKYCPDDVSTSEVIDKKAMSYPFSVRTAAMYLDIAIFKEIMAGRGTANDGVYFDVTHVGAERLHSQAPITYDTLKSAGVDMAEEVIELGLVVQNFNGGILIDEHGFTGVPGLYAAGEVTGGVHGSDRPGGNNLTDTQVFGYRAGRAAGLYATEMIRNDADPIYKSNNVKIDINEKEEEILKTTEDLYYKEMTIVRTEQGLLNVLSFIEENLSKTDSLILRNRLLVGQIMALAMLTRQESRGTHYRDDYNESNPDWSKRIIIRKGDDGRPQVRISEPCKISV